MVSVNPPEDWVNPVVRPQRLSWDEYFFEVAKAAAKRASCPRRQVGAVLVYRNRVVGMGYNGSPPGEPHCIDEGVGCLMVDGHCKRTIHAEKNALKNAGMLPLGIGFKTVTLYSTLEPCVDCRTVLEKAFLNIKFKWLEDYPKPKGDGIIGPMHGTGIWPAPTSLIARVDWTSTTMSVSLTVVQGGPVARQSPQDPR